MDISGPDLKAMIEAAVHTPAVTFTCTDSPDEHLQSMWNFISLPREASQSCWLAEACKILLLLRLYKSRLVTPMKWKARASWDDPQAVQRRHP